MLAWNSIDISSWAVQAKLIKTRNKWEISDPRDQIDFKNPVITLDSMGNNPSD